MTLKAFFFSRHKGGLRTEFSVSGRKTWEEDHLGDVFDLFES